MPKVKFCIQEYTQGSSKKVYGPYVGHYHKYTAAELKKAMTADGKVKFTMKPVVKLKGKNMKGGLGGGELYEILETIQDGYKCKCLNCTFITNHIIYYEEIRGYNHEKYNLPKGTKLKK